MLTYEFKSLLPQTRISTNHTITHRNLLKYFSLDFVICKIQKRREIRLRWASTPVGLIITLNSSDVLHCLPVRGDRPQLGDEVFACIVGG